MWRRVLRTVLILSVLAGLWVFPPTASACSCAPPGTPAAEFTRVDAVFVGAVNSVIDLGPLAWLMYWLQQWVNPQAGMSGDQYVSLSVSDSWKGVATTSVVLRNFSSGATCGYPFTVGVHYVVYAYNYQGDWMGSLCSRTSEVSQAATDLTYLQTLPKLPLTPTLPIPLLICLAAIIGMGLGLAALGWFVQRRRKAARPSSAA